MSRLARKPIVIPEKVDVKINDDLILVSGPKGELKRNFKHTAVKIDVKEGSITVSPARDSGGNKKEARALLGTYASHIKNMIEGVVNGFEKKLVVEGVGYKAEVRGSDLVMSLGFSHPVNFKIPDGAAITTEKNTIIIKGIDKEKVGLAASKIRMLKKPEPYKGKGIRYFNEVVKRKAGKKAGA